MNALLVNNTAAFLSAVMRLDLHIPDLLLVVACAFICSDPIVFMYEIYVYYHFNFIGFHGGIISI